MQYIHIHAIHAYTYNTYIYIPYKQHVNMIHTNTYIYIHIHTYTCKYNPSTYMQVFVQYFKNIHAYTYKYTQYEHQKSNTYFLEPYLKVYVLGIYLLVFASICVSICKYLVSICMYCIYLQVFMQLTLLCALSTCKYLQILTEILAYTYTKYVQIRANRSGCICMYLHVYTCIWQYMHLSLSHQVAGVVRIFYIASICMYLHVYASI
jgi:hypothetical protein